MPHVPSTTITRAYPRQVMGADGKVVPVGEVCTLRVSVARSHEIVMGLRPAKPDAPIRTHDKTDAGGKA